MNAPLHPILHDPLNQPVHASHCPTEQAEGAIGRLITASAAFEAKLTLLLRVLDPDASPKLLPSQKIKAIRDALLAKGSKDLHQRQHGRIGIILQEAEKLLALRHECAHSCVTAIVLDDEPHWLLRNAQTAGDPLDRCVLVSKAQMAATTGRIKQLAHQLHQILNPPLPPQPKPDAAAAP